MQKKGLLRVIAKYGLFLIVAVVLSLGFQSVKSRTAFAKKGPVYEVLNPRGIMQEVKLTPLAPRVPNLTGKVVYCVSQHVGDADIFLKKVADSLPKYALGVKAVFKPKPGVYMSDDTELWDEIAKEADALIYGCAA